jgi:CRISPR-associated endonuclease/helicase Cas3
MTAESREASFVGFFRTATDGFAPYRWQLQVALEGLPDILPIPTGLGKTEVALAWAWRLLIDKQTEPRHLVVCLPMRSLVTQTVQRLTSYFDRLKTGQREIDVTVHQLMGGAIDDDWGGQPEHPWILVGTQDQLLSRALNRGYSMSRFEWPVHFGLLNNDCRWLIDEVQLMGPGLWTTSQLDWMRRKRFESLKPCLTTWMSATVGTSFLSTTDRVRDALAEPSMEQVEFEAELKTALDGDAGLEWWRAAKRPLAWWQPEPAAHTTTGGGRKRGSAKSAGATAVTPDAIATSVKAQHLDGTLSLVICNTVDMARAVFRALSSVDHKVLLTSRFRREDRARHEQRLIDFEAQRKAGQLPEHHPGLICVSTQVIEAGVDISAHRLFTELAPWPSMLQRLGRLNRKGDDQDAQAWVWETPRERGNKKERIGPYEAADMDRAKRLVCAFALLSEKTAFSEAIARLNAKEVAEALQPRPSPLPRALDVHGLFSTERDVHGGFTDVSAFVRGTDPDLDVTVFWRDWSGESPPREVDLDGPLLELAKEGCQVSCFGKRGVREFLESTKSKAWLWDDEAGRWERVNHWDIRPGMLVMLKRNVGGYDETEGWTGDKSNVLAEVPLAGRGATLRDDTWTEVGYWSKLEDHLRDARHEAERLCGALALAGDIQRAVVEASGLHDLGKAHPQWQAKLPDRSGIPDALLAKSPRVVAADVWGDASAVRAEFITLRPQAHSLADEARRRGREDVVRLRWAIDNRLSDAEVKSLRAVAGVRWAGHLPFRPGLRHEVASALAMWRKYSDSETKPYPALAVYLAATHHGKARTVMRSTTGEGDDVFGVRREPRSLIVGDEEWPLDFSIAKDGAEGRWEGHDFVLTGHGWTGLVADLLGPWRPEERSDAGAVPEHEPRRLGPFALAYLEALVRIADWRASAQPSASTKPSEVRSGR